MRLHGFVVINSIILITGSLAISEKKKDNPKSIAEITDFQSVTHFEGIERLYQNLRTSNNAGPPPLEPKAWRKRTNVKKKICKSVFTSHFFIMRSEEYLDTDNKEVRADLARDEGLSDTFTSIYKRREKPAFFLFFWDRDEYQYENAYKARTARVGSVVSDDHTFACIARSSDGRIRDYFVTQPYNVNAAEDGLTMLGRFIFTRNTNGDLVLLALAEEAAQEVRFIRKASFLETGYIATRSQETKRRFIPNYDDEDPVCGLSPANKLRLCSSLFSATSLKIFGRNEPSFKKDEVVFKPIIDKDRLHCVNKQIAYTTPGTGTFGGWVTGVFLHIGDIDASFEDRMIACVGTTREGFEMVYYVSRGMYDKSNTVYVFTDAEFRPGRVSLFNFFSNVSVIKKWD